MRRNRQITPIWSTVNTSSSQVFGGGVIVTTGFVHILGDGASQLASVSTFPAAFTLCLGSIIFMFFLEQVSVAFFRSHLANKAASQTASVDGARAGTTTNNNIELSNATTGESDADQAADELSDADSEHAFLVDGSSEATVASRKEQAATATTTAVPDKPARHSPHSQHGHSHHAPHHSELDEFRDHDHASEPHHHDHVHAPLEFDHGGSVKAAVVAHVLEFGILVHSVLIGVDLGITTDYKTLRSLLIALCFHQFFEGIGLGAAIASARIRRRKAAIFATFFAFTTPIGVAIGIGVAHSYNPDSRNAQWTQGTLNSLASGILIYAGLVEMVVEDFSRCEATRPMKKVAMGLALLGGYGAMALLANWA